MFETIYPYCRGNLLEIGSGIGNISQFFVEKKCPITLSDTEKLYTDLLKVKFDASPVLSIDLVHPEFSALYQKYFQSFDTVIFLNVLEHIKEHERAIENSRKFLKKGSTLIILVPAYSFLFSKIDMGLGHYRRYTKKSLSGLLFQNNIVVRKGFYFNALGLCGWWYGKMAGLKKIPGGNMKIFNKLIPIAKIIDKIFFRKFGLSVIVVAGIEESN